MRSDFGSIRQLQPGVWRVEVSHGRDPATGQRRRLSRTVRGRKRDAEAMRSRLLLEAGARPDSTMRLKDYLEAVWLPWVKGTVRTRTWDGYESKVRLYIVPRLGSTRLSEIEPYELDQWLADIRKHHSERTALHAYSVLRNALNRAVKWKLITVDPVLSVDAPEVPQELPDALEVPEAMQYLDWFKGDPVELAVVLGIACGLRRSEIAGLNRTDIRLWQEEDEDGARWWTGEVSITKGRHQAKGAVWEEEPKSRTSRRVVPLPSWAAETLLPYRGFGPLILEKGAPMTPNRISAAYVRRRKAGVKAGVITHVVSLKNLRHSHATIALGNGVDLIGVSRNLGHSTTAVADRFYLAPRRQTVEKVAEAMEILGKRAASGGKSAKAASGGNGTW